MSKLLLCIQCSSLNYIQSFRVLNVVNSFLFCGSSNVMLWILTMGSSQAYYCRVAKVVENIDLLQ